MNFRAPPASRRGLRDWTDLIFKDHGFLRIWWHNFHEVAPGMFRSNQPSPSRVHAAARQGIRTIINLRGPRSDGGWQLEAEACAEAGITFLDFTARSRAAPDKAMRHATRTSAPLRPSVASAKAVKSSLPAAVREPSASSAIARRASASGSGT